MQIPAWTFILCAMGLWIYQTLDNIDGKQARRIGAANPLGELFDHGCDALSTSVVMASYILVLKVNKILCRLFTCRKVEQNFVFFLLYALALTLYYITHWECYVKDRLLFQTCVFLASSGSSCRIDVTEAHYYLIVCYFAAAFWPGFFDFVIFGFVVRNLIVTAAYE